MRLPDHKLLIWMAIPLVALVALLATVQAVDPLRPFTYIEKGDGETVRDYIFTYCGTGETGGIISGLFGCAMVRCASQLGILLYLIWHKFCSGLGAVLRCHHGIFDTQHCSVSE